MKLQMMFPLIGKDDCTKEDAKIFEDLLKNECERLQKLEINADFCPEYCFAKTKNGQSYGIILSQEERYSKKNFIHKYGYKSHRISYTKEMMTEDFLKNILHSKLKNFESKTYKVIQAFTLDQNSNLEFIGSMSYFINKKKNAYLDGAYVEPKYQRQGVASSMLEVLHLLVAAAGAKEISADSYKDIKTSEYSEEADVNYKSNSFNMLSQKGYKTENKKIQYSSESWTNPLKIAEKDLILKNLILTPEDFYKEKTIQEQIERE